VGAAAGPDGARCGRSELKAVVNTAPAAVPTTNALIATAVSAPPELAATGSMAASANAAVDVMLPIATEASTRSRTRLLAAGGPCPARRAAASKALAS
jgi:hypothetical protein